MFDIGDFFDLSFHLFGESIEFFDFVLDFNCFNLLYTLSNIFSKKSILFLFFILIIFGLWVFLEKFDDIGQRGNFNFSGFESGFKTGDNFAEVVVRVLLMRLWGVVYRFGLIFIKIVDMFF